MNKYNITNKILRELLAEAKREHMKYEHELGHEDKDWPGWYADYIMKKLEGMSLLE